MKIELRQLHYLLAIDRHRNFARAAEAIGLSQPALSRSLQVLEKSVGARLFDRDRARVEPTAIGVRLIKRARLLVNEAEDMERELTQLLGLQAGLLRLGAGPYPADISVGTAVGRLVRDHPGLRVDVSVGDWPALTERVLTGDIDLAVAESSLALAEPRLAVELLPEHEGIFFCRAGHPLGGRDALTLEDMRQFPFAVTMLPARLLALAAKDGVAPRTDLPPGMGAPEIRVETFQLARCVVLESNAIGVAAPGQIAGDIEQGRLVVLPLAPSWLRTRYAMIRLAGRTPSPVADAFMQVLREVEAGIAQGRG